jgi:hypothetical protein
MDEGGIIIANPIYREVIERTTAETATTPAGRIVTVVRG